jgi:hypothetical protein
LIINTFISDGDKIPEYTLLSLQRLRELNPDERILFIADNIKPYGSFFTKNRIEHVWQSEIKSDLLDEFNELSQLKRHGRPNTKYPSPNYFFHRAMERIYYLEAVISQNNYENVWHFENDVLTYLPNPNLSVAIDKVMITPMGHRLATFAVTYIPNPTAINMLCNQFNDYLTLGENILMETYHLDMINEMTLAGISTEVDHFQTLPINTGGEQLLTDPGSYGQYLGGTNNHDHGPGYAGSHHYIGKSILDGKIIPAMIYGKPFVLEVETDIFHPLFNLHIHSKNLKDFL